MSVRLRAAGIALAVGAALWVPMTSVGVVASIGLATGRGLGVFRTTDPKVLPWAAWVYWRHHRANPTVARLLPLSAGGAAALALVPALAALCWPESRRLRQARSGERPPPVRRARSSTYGSADWMTAGEVGQWFPGGAAGHGGVVLGQLGGGGDAPLLVDPCEDAHGFVVGGTGTGKTASVTIPTLDPTVGWRSSVVVFDPSCEVAQKTSGMRIAAGQRVVILGLGGQGMNVLDWIDTADPLAEAHVRSVVHMIGKERPEHDSSDPMWQGSAKAIQFAVLAHMLWDPLLSKSEKTLKRFARMVAIPEKDLRWFLQDIHAESPCEQARIAAGTLMSAPDKTFGGFYRSAQTDIEWLLTSAYADMVSGQALSSDALADGHTTVFVQIPMSTLQDTPEVGRTVIHALLQGLYRREGRVNGRVLFLLDEVNLLGAMKALAVARDNARKYQVAIVPMWQSLGQITDTWGVGGKRNWMGSSAWQWFAGVNDEHTAEEISKRCGTYTGLGRNESTSQGSGGWTSTSANNRNQSAGTSEISVPLIRPEEVLKMSRKERFVFRAGAPPLRCHAALWFKRPEMVAKIESACGLYVAAREDA